MPAVLTVAAATSFRLWPQELLSSTRCQCHDSDSLAATTTMSSSQLYKALPAGEEGRKEINAPNPVCTAISWDSLYLPAQLSLSPTSDLRHHSSVNVPVTNTFHYPIDVLYDVL